MLSSRKALIPSFDLNCLPSFDLNKLPSVDLNKLPSVDLDEYVSIHRMEQSLDLNESIPDPDQFSLQDLLGSEEEERAFWTRLFKEYKQDLELRDNI